MLPTSPVTEFAILRLKHDRPHTDSELYAYLRRVSAEQSAWSSFPLHWFTYTTTNDGPARETDTFICILSQWASVPAHQVWIDSAQNQELLALLSPTIELASFCHVALKSDEVDKVLGTDKLRWKYLTEEVLDKGDASGWAVDTSEPRFYVFKIVGSEEVGSESKGGWTTMSRLDLSNL
ncbi:hypothetical protein FRC07_009583 [Ceratobasidium sp. 392]|nr:hypothetical protein FRC07_009583 [Ceratobasidium sp. 392]